jgi:hypothetical protein
MATVTAATEPNPGESPPLAYWRFLTMIGTSTLVVYAMMRIIMVSMYTNRLAELFFLAGAAVPVALEVRLVRNRATIGGRHT